MLRVVAGHLRVVTLVSGLALTTLLFAPIVLGVPPGTQTVAVNVTAVGHYGGSTSAIEIDGQYAYVAAGNGLSILSISDPVHPALVSRVGPFFSTIDGLIIVGGRLYVTEFRGPLHVVDVSDPTHPLALGQYQPPSWLNSVAVSGNYAYVTADGDGLRVLDVTDPADIVEVGHYNTPGTAVDVTVSGDYAYVADRASGLRIIDVSDPENPVSVASVDTPHDALSVRVHGNFVYLSDSSSLRIYDVSIPAAPVARGVWVGGASMATLVWPYAFVSSIFSYSNIVDISDPDAPTGVAHIVDQYVGYDLGASGSYLFTTNRAPNLRVYDISTVANPQLVGQYDEPDGCQFAVNNQKLYVGDDRLFTVDTTDPQLGHVIGQSEARGLGDGNRIRIVGPYAYVASDGLEIFDVADPANPSWVGALDQNTTVYDVDILGGYAYLTTMNGLSIIDVTNPASPSEEGSFTDVSDVRRVDAFELNDSRYAILTPRTTQGMTIVNVDTPSEPALVAAIKTAKYSDVVVAGHYAYAAAIFGGVQVFDLQDIAHPSVVATIPYASSPNGAQGLVAVSNGKLFVLTQSGYTNDIENLRVYDLSDPANPVEVSSFSPIHGTGLEVFGSRLYISDCSGGVQVFEFVAPVPSPTPTASPTDMALPTETPTGTALPTETATATPSRTPDPNASHVWIPVIWREPYQDIALP